MNFLANIFSGTESASFGRFSSFISLVCILAWTSLKVAAGKDVPDIPETWLIVILGPYGITKLGEWANRKIEPKPETPPA